MADLMLAVYEPTKSAVSIAHAVSHLRAALLDHIVDGNEMVSPNA